MLSLVALALSSTPVPLTCEQLWPEVWARFATVETAATPFFRRFPHGQALLAQKWVLECEAFDAGTLACARRETLERELAELRGWRRDERRDGRRGVVVWLFRNGGDLLDDVERQRHALHPVVEVAPRRAFTVPESGRPRTPESRCSTSASRSARKVSTFKSR